MAVLRLTTSIERLIEAAEYEADRVAAVSRSLFATMVLVLFLVRPPPGIPPSFAGLIEFAPGLQSGHCRLVLVVGNTRKAWPPRGRSVLPCRLRIVRGLCGRTAAAA